ncbi:MAG TPA: hypothetical protein VGP80_09410 [Gemmatimonadales bacterium]|nr:hypothetical protein [Gemmatimonadales bacterium]
MNARARVSTTRQQLSAAVIGASLGWGLAVAMILLLLAALGDLVFGLAYEIRFVTRIGAIALGVVAALVVLLRNRGAWHIEGVALWLEEKAPNLNYALVTLIQGAGGSIAALEQHVAQVDWRAPVRRRIGRGTVPPLLLASIATGAFLLLPANAVTRIRAPRPDDGFLAPRGSGESADPFRPLLVRVMPPAYSGQAERTLENPIAVAGLQGSRLLIEGPARLEALVAGIGDSGLSVATNGDHWSISLEMPASPRVLTLTSGTRHHLLTLEPEPDSIPQVQLLLPSRDTARRAVTGVVQLDARAGDDFGLDSAWFEYIISSGEGENFTFRSGVLGRHAGDDNRSVAFTALLTLDSLHLAGGNVIHVRAVARDRNTTTGPGLAASETRTIRILRADEGDSVSVDAMAPAQGDSSLLSQRMLLLLTETLQRRRPRLRRDTVVEESRAIARDQSALRRRVADVIFMRLGGEGNAEESEGAEGESELTPEALMRAASDTNMANGGRPLDFSQDESPVVALNLPLLEAYNAMWDAGRELEIGEPGRAIPHMHAALDAIQRARQAERLYLRGQPKPVVVDLSRVRLAGKLTDASPAPESRRETNGEVSARLLDRFTLALALLPDERAVDSLTVLRIDALHTAPGFAQALAQAIAELRTGRDATESLVRARRLLAGVTATTADLPSWSGAP